MSAKPTNTEGRVPDAAVEAIVRRFVSAPNERASRLAAGHSEAIRATARLDLAAALPALEDSFKERVRERLMGDRFVNQVMGEAAPVFVKERVRNAVHDALAALDSEDHRG